MQQASTWLAAGRYEVGEVVGRGGYGMVCRGFDRKTRTSVALKMLSPEAGRDPNVVERMLREQQALVALSGTCAVTAIDLCRLESGAPCLVMEWLDGCDLEQQLSVWEAAGQRGSLPQLRDIVRALSQTLARAHDLGLVHRDIKPANVFLVAEPIPSVRLLDFGLSRMKTAAPLTAMGMVMGSPSYIAPETWRGNSTALDGRADLFALAVIVFRYLTGNLPFDAPDLIAKMTAVTSGPRPSVVALRPDLPGAVDAWMTRALAVDPDDRFQTGSDFLAAFEAALRGETLVVRAETSGVRPVSHTLGSGAPSRDERESALTSAWRAAATLLKRFTQPRERPTLDSNAPPAREPSAPPARAPSAPPEPPVSTPQPSLPAPTVVSAPLNETTTAAPLPYNEQPPLSERSTVWLDSVELQDLEPDSGYDSAPMTLRSELPPAPSVTQATPEPAPLGTVERAPTSASEPSRDLLSASEIAIIGEGPSAQSAPGKSKGARKGKADKKSKTKKDRSRKKAKGEAQPATKKPRGSRKK